MKVLLDECLPRKLKREVMLMLLEPYQKWVERRFGDSPATTGVK